MAITLKSDLLTNATISVILKLTPKSALGTKYPNAIHIQVYMNFSITDTDFDDDDIEVLFGPNSTLVSVNVTIFDDIYPEFNEIFDISIIIPPAMKEIGVKNGNISRAIGVILNDDSKLIKIDAAI